MYDIAGVFPRRVILSEAKDLAKYDSVIHMRSSFASSGGPSLTLGMTAENCAAQRWEIRRGPNPVRNGLHR